MACTRMCFYLSSRAPFKKVVLIQSRTSSWDTVFSGSHLSRHLGSRGHFLLYLAGELQIIFIRFTGFNGHTNASQKRLAQNSFVLHRRRTAHAKQSSRCIAALATSGIIPGGVLLNDFMTVRLIEKFVYYKKILYNALVAALKHSVITKPICIISTGYKDLVLHLFNSFIPPSLVGYSTTCDILKTIYFFVVN
jgi:hypothetical protein